MKKVSTKQAVDIFGEDALPVLEKKQTDLTDKITFKKEILVAYELLYSLKLKLISDDIPFSQMSLVEPLFKAVNGKDCIRIHQELENLTSELKRITFALRCARKEVKEDELDVERAKEYPLENLLSSNVRGSGDRIQTYCPFHEEEHPSFMVYKHSNSFYCFSCKRGGDVINLTMELKGLNFRDAVRFLS